MSSETAPEGAAFCVFSSKAATRPVNSSIVWVVERAEAPSDGDASVSGAGEPSPDSPSAGVSDAGGISCCVSVLPEVICSCRSLTCC